MREAGSGVILNVGWDQADRGMAGDSGELFATAKGAVMAFTRSLARSLAPQVRVNCLAPGWIRSAWGEGALPHWQDRARESLLERWGRRRRRPRRKVPRLTGGRIHHRADRSGEWRQLTRGVSLGTPNAVNCAAKDDARSRSFCHWSPGRRKPAERAGASLSRRFRLLDRGTRAFRWRR